MAQEPADGCVHASTSSPGDSARARASRRASMWSRPAAHPCMNHACAQNGCDVGCNANGNSATVPSVPRPGRAADAAVASSSRPLVPEESRMSASARIERPTCSPPSSPAIRARKRVDHDGRSTDASEEVIRPRSVSLRSSVGNNSEVYAFRRASPRSLQRCRRRGTP